MYVGRALSVCARMYSKSSRLPSLNRSLLESSVYRSPGLSLSDSHIQGSLNKGEVGLKGLGMTLQVHKALLAFLKESWSHRLIVTTSWENKNSYNFWGLIRAWEYHCSPLVVGTWVGQVIKMFWLGCFSWRTEYVCDARIISQCLGCMTGLDRCTNHRIPSICFLIHGARFILTELIENLWNYPHLPK